MNTTFYSENLKGTSHLEYIGKNEWVIPETALKQWSARLSDTVIWLSTAVSLCEYGEEICSSIND